MIDYDPKEYAQYHQASVKILQEKNAEIARLRSDNQELCDLVGALTDELKRRPAGYGELEY